MYDYIIVIHTCLLLKNVPYPYDSANALITCDVCLRILLLWVIVQMRMILDHLGYQCIDNSLCMLKNLPTIMGDCKTEILDLLVNQCIDKPLIYF